MIGIGNFPCYIVSKFDDLSILEVKESFCLNWDIREKLENQIQELEKQLNETLGYTKSKEIYNSEEYEKLYKLNKQIFDEVEKIKDSEIQKLNKKRFEAKKQLNKIFFGEELGEIKI